MQFDILEVELSGDLRFVRTRCHGTIAPKGQNPEGSEGNRELFVVKEIAVSGSFTATCSTPWSEKPRGR